MTDDFYEKDKSLLKIRVNTKASKNAILGVRNNMLVISTTVVPEKGKANEAVIHLLSKELHIPSSSISIVSGLKSRNKVVQITSKFDITTLQKMAKDV